MQKNHYEPRSTHSARSSREDSVCLVTSGGGEQKQFDPYFVRHPKPLNPWHKVPAQRQRTFPARDDGDRS